MALDTYPEVIMKMHYRSGTVNSNTVNSKFHLIRTYYEIFFYHFPNIPCLKYTVNSNFHLIRRKTLPTNGLQLTVPDLYYITSTGTVLALWVIPLLTISLLDFVMTPLIH